MSCIFIHTHTFLKNIYIKTHIYIFGTGRDWDDLVPCPVPSRPEEEFCPVPKLFGTEISRPEMPRNWTGRAGQDGMGNC